MSRKRAVLLVVVGLAFGALTSSAWGSTTFQPRIGGAMGIMPPVGSSDVASGAQTPLVYHAGEVMSGGVTVHTIFWAPPGYKFDGSPGAGILGYEAMIKQFLVDVAHDSGSSNSIFSVLPQFAQGTRVGAITPGSYSVSFDPVANSIDDTNPYPAPTDQCQSPSGIPTCVTDAQIQAEIDRVVQATPGTPRGLHHLWYVFLPPNVDECILPGACGTNAFGGYHSLSNVGGHGVTIYALTIDPLIERTVAPGSDPQGNPDAEATVNITAHEVVEAMTDPEGVGWMDPNGFEVGDKCQTGPQRGTPLGFAGPHNSPYNQLINGTGYLVQEMWSNNDRGCVQRTSLNSNPLPLPQVNLIQFGSMVTGNIGSNASGVGVKVSLQRAAADGSRVTVASASGTTAADGSWMVSLASHAVGDDRDQIAVDYSGAGAPAPSHQVIRTGNGGNPFTESGWTGWVDLDNGSFVTNQGGSSITMGPCFQTGVLGVTFSGSPLSSPTDFCNTQTDTATVGTPAIGPGSVLRASSNDNRAFSPPNGGTPNPNGGLVSLSVPVGEPDAASLFVNPLATLSPSGFPSCTADLEAQNVTCTGLVPGRHYTLTDGRTGAHVAAGADGTGTATGQLAIGTLHGGDSVSLSNGSRTLSTLHVAHLKVSITGEQTVLSGGTCEPGAYYGPPLTEAPTNGSAGGHGVALTGEICPLGGQAAGLDTALISQTDEFSGGQTQTEVPDIQNTSPIQGETVTGSFTALAQSGLPGPHNSVIPTDKTSAIALRITPAAGGRPVFSAGNVDTANGVAVKGLKPGTYVATWKLRDAAGDTRTLTTRFVQKAGPLGHVGPRAKVGCKLARHNAITCTVTYPQAKATHGMLRMTIAHGGQVAALGRAVLSRGAATVTLRMVRRLTARVWTVTLVLTQAHKPPSTSTIILRT